MTRRKVLFHFVIIATEQIQNDYGPGGSYAATYDGRVWGSRRPLTSTHAVNRRNPPGEGAQLRQFRPGIYVSVIDRRRLWTVWSYLHEIIWAVTRPADSGNERERVK